MAQKGTLREFLYVDVERSRSMLAQINRGVIDGIVKRTGTTGETEIGGKLLGIGASGTIGRESVHEESRSLQDITYLIFEEQVAELGYLHDIAGKVEDPSVWQAGTIHDELWEGELIRLTSDIQILDPDFFVARLRRMNEFAEAVVKVSSADRLAGLSKQQRDKLLTQAKRKLWDGTDPSLVDAIADVVSSLLAGSIAIRVLPCGPDEPEFSFGGVLLGRKGYIQEEREALFGRYGRKLRGWTAVLQIATIPSIAEAEAEAPDFASISLTGPGDEIKRASVEKMAVEFLGLLERIGIAEGPRWPSISTTPIAIYREVD
jgi:hypothetical protein